MSRPPRHRSGRAIAGIATMLAAGASAASRTNLTVSTADGDRDAIVVPVGAGPQPTVIVLHGALGTAALTLRGTGFAEAAARHGFNAVFPDGIDRHWHDGRAGEPERPDDVVFLRALVARLISDKVALPGRVYLAGISNGGMMSFTMACKAGELFAGIGTVIASMPEGIAPCAIKPGRVVMINGTADPVVPFAGGSVGLRGGRGRVWSVKKTTDLFAEANGCAGQHETPLPDRDTTDQTTVTRIDWAGCKPGSSLTLYRIEGGGHAVAGRPPLSRTFLGPSNLDIVAADVILDAFSGRP